MYKRTCDISLKSWLTNSTPPSKLLIASASVSMVSKSRWLVGSSSNNRWGLCQANQANITRQRWPSDKLRIGTIWKHKEEVCYEKPHVELEIMYMKIRHLRFWEGRNWLWLIWSYMKHLTLHLKGFDKKHMSKQTNQDKLEIPIHQYFNS